MDDVAREPRVLFGDVVIHSHRAFLRALQLRRKHRRFAKDRDAAFALGVCRIFNRRFKIGVWDLLSFDLSGAEGRDNRAEGENEN